MLLRLRMFEHFVDGIERRGRRRLPASERKARELLRLCRVIDGHAGLRESFPRDLQRLLRIVEYGPEEAWVDSEAARAQLRAFAGPAGPVAGPAGPGAGTAGGEPEPAGGEPEPADAVIERALTVACPLIKEAFDVFILRKNGFLDDQPLSKGVLLLP
jgi:hypothetical protein